MIPMKDPLGEDLVTVQIDGAAAHLAPVHRKSLGSAVIQIDLLFQILMEADTDVGIDSGHKEDRVGVIRGHAMGQGMVEGLRPQRWNKPQVKETNGSHWPPPEHARSGTATAPGNLHSVKAWCRARRPN